MERNGSEVSRGAVATRNRVELNSAMPGDVLEWSVQNPGGAVTHRGVVVGFPLRGAAPALVASINCRSAANTPTNLSQNQVGCTDASSRIPFYPAGF